MITVRSDSAAYRDFTFTTKLTLLLFEVDSLVVLSCCFTVIFLMSCHLLCYFLLYSVVFCTCCAHCCHVVVIVFFGLASLYFVLFSVLKSAS